MVFVTVDPERLADTVARLQKQATASGERPPQAADAGDDLDDGDGVELLALGRRPRVWSAQRAAPQARHLREIGRFLHMAACAPQNEADP